MAISSDLLSSTLFSIRDTEVDALYNKVAVLDGMRKNGGVESINGGIKIQRPLSIQDHSGITQLQSGYEPVDLAVQNVLQPAIYDWCDFTQPIVISKKEEMENSSEHAQIRIVEARMRNVMASLRRELNKQILSGRSTVLSDMNTLNGLDISTGFLENAAPLAQVGTVGGLSKGTYLVDGWHNRYLDASAGFAISDLYDMYIDANAVAPAGDVSHLIMSKGAMASYRDALFAQERFVQSDKLDGGRMVLAFNGAGAEYDPVMGFTADSDVVSAYMLNYDGIKLVFHPEGDFNVSPFENISGTTARAALLYVKVQLIADHLGSQGLYVNAG